jgi:hypothetical protein
LRFINSPGEGSDEKNYYPFASARSRCRKAK